MFIVIYEIFYSSNICSLSIDLIKQSYSVFWKNKGFLYSISLVESICFVSY